jgi:hypothetical protein
VKYSLISTFICSFFDNSVIYHKCNFLPGFSPPSVQLSWTNKWCFYFSILCQISSLTLLSIKLIILISPVWIMIMFYYFNTFCILLFSIIKVMFHPWKALLWLVNYLPHKTFFQHIVFSLIFPVHLFNAIGHLLFTLALWFQC